MTELITCLSTGKGTWGHVAGLMRAEEWEKVYLVCSDFGRDKFEKHEKHEFIVINPDDDVEQIIGVLYEKLKGRLGTEVAVNMISGSGKEHMALLSALLKLGVGLRFVVLKEGRAAEI